MLNWRLQSWQHASEDAAKCVAFRGGSLNLADSVCDTGGRDDDDEGGDGGVSVGGSGTNGGTKKRGGN